MTEEIKTIREAITHACAVIEKYEKISQIENQFGEKGLMGAFITTPNNKYSITFRRNLFKSYSYIDDEGLPKKGLGVAHGKEQLYTYSGNNILPIIVLSDGKMYLYPAKSWIEWCEKRKDDTNVIRADTERENKVDTWTYYNIPISLMINYEKWIIKTEEK